MRTQKYVSIPVAEILEASGTCGQGVQRVTDGWDGLVLGTAAAVVA